MPLTRSFADAFGVLTICLVALLFLLGLLCIIYSFYFRSSISSQGLLQLHYFNGPWIIRIAIVLFSIWCGCGEISRLSFLRREGRVLSALNWKWQESICKCYIVSSLGFAEPCLFLTLVFLLRAPLQKMETGILSPNWNMRTAGLVLFYCLPVCALQLVFILIVPELNKDKGPLAELPRYFTRTTASAIQNSDSIALCTYPLLSSSLLGFFAMVLTLYLCWLGRRILKLVINKALKRRVFSLILSVSVFLPLRVLFLGLSILSEPDRFLFEALAFSAFLALLFCIGVCICVLVYYPVADCYALGNSCDLELSRRIPADNNETVALISDRSHLEESARTSPDRISDSSSAVRGSISFRAFGKDGTSTGTSVELSLFSPGHDMIPPGSSPLLGWPMRPPASYMFCGSKQEFSG